MIFFQLEAPGIAWNSSQKKKQLSPKLEPVHVQVHESEEIFGKTQ